MRSTALPIAITMGDPSGIGPEIVAKFFARRLVEDASSGEGEARPAIMIGEQASDLILSSHRSA